MKVEEFFNHSIVYSKTHAFILKFTDELNLRSGEKIIGLLILSIHDTWKSRNILYNNNRLKISTPTWNDEFELPDGSYSLSDIQDYFEYLFKKIIKRLIICKNIIKR